MDWQLCIDRNRAALLTLITALMASLGLVTIGAPASGLANLGGAKYAKLTTLPAYLVTRALSIIRPVESALRRVIMIAALKLTPQTFAPAKPRGRSAAFIRRNPPAEPRLPTFNLLDPLKTFYEDAPDFGSFGFAGNQHAGQHDRTPVPAEALGRRLLALKNALDTIDKQAKRLCRWYQQRDAARAQNQPHRLNPIRPGRPPWSHKRKRSEIDKLLTECHLMAIYARDGQENYRNDSS